MNRWLILTLLKMFNPDPDTPGGTQGGIVGGGGDAGSVVALLQLGGALYDSYQNRKTSKENTQNTINAAKSESELAYQRSVQMWNEQNLYNSPQAQMARFGNAGLNPHLIYGQGSAGNASSPPQYQPANMQYRVEAPSYGAAISSVMPTLMAVGTWMQQMRLSEMQIDKGSTETEKSRQMIDYLTDMNPQLLKQMDNKLSLYPYQYDMQKSLSSQARTKLYDMDQEFRYKFGDEQYGLWGSTATNVPQGGIRRLQFLQQQSATKLAEAKSSWTDFDITNPQAIIQMVMQGMMGLAGQTLRLSTHRPTVRSRR